MILLVILYHLSVLITKEEENYYFIFVYLYWKKNDENQKIKATKEKEKETYQYSNCVVWLLSCLHLDDCLLLYCGDMTPKKKETRKKIEITKYLCRLRILL